MDTDNQKNQLQDKVDFRVVKYNDRKFIVYYARNLLSSLRKYDAKQAEEAMKNLAEFCEKRKFHYHEQPASEKSLSAAVREAATKDMFFIVINDLD